MNIFICIHYILCYYSHISNKHKETKRGNKLHIKFSSNNVEPDFYQYYCTYLVAYYCRRNV